MDILYQNYFFYGFKVGNFLEPANQIQVNRESASLPWCEAKKIFEVLQQQNLFVYPHKTNKQAKTKQKKKCLLSKKSTSLDTVDVYHKPFPGEKKQKICAESCKAGIWPQWKSYMLHNIKICFTVEELLDHASTDERKVRNAEISFMRIA